MKLNRVALVVSVLCVSSVMGQEPGNAPGASGETAFQSASQTAHRQLAESLEELAALNQEIASQKVPLSRRLNELEQELADLRKQYQDASKQLDARTLDVTNMRKSIAAHQEEQQYLSNLLAEYLRQFESRLHIVELQQYREAIDTASRTANAKDLSPQQVFQAQLTAVDVSLARLDAVLGRTRFAGRAVGEGSRGRPGTFVLVGPAALFGSDDGQSLGTAEQVLGSLEPTVLPFGDASDALAAAELVATGSGWFPLDPTLGHAHKVESTQETLVEHIRKGGPVMVPILLLAATALLVAVYKWMVLSLLRKPSPKRIEALLKAVASGDRAAMVAASAAIRGPVGQMLAAGVEHIDEPRDLIEEVMYEKVLATRLKVNRLLPFVAISASSAPLLGLLGTVTGIINTFKLITVFGSGDVKTLSGGISEALITTEFGLIVAIPSLLLYAFLSRKARGIVDQMEKAAIAFVNQISKQADRANRIAPTAAATGIVEPRTA